MVPSLTSLYERDISLHLQWYRTCTRERIARDKIYSLVAMAEIKTLNIRRIVVGPNKSS